MANYRRSPYETACDIDLFEVATNEDTTKVFWQFLDCDENPHIADIHRCFWQMFDERESPLMSTFYKDYLAKDSGTGTFGRKGQPVTVREKFAGARERYTINTTVQT